MWGAEHSCKALDPSCTLVESGGFVGEHQLYPANTDNIYIFRKVLHVLLDASLLESKPAV